MRARLPFVALLLITLPLAGCIDTSLDTAVDPLALASQVRYDELLAEHLPIEADDGTLLDAWVFRPDTTETGEKVPVIINFSPYWSNLAPPAETGGDAFSQYLLDHFVPRGYAVALVSARGTGLSEGCFGIGGPREVQDESLVVDALATRAWANGNVTATGKSYDGTMAQGLITTGNPHVKTIVPVSPISELYKYNHFDGVPYPNGYGTNQFNTYYVALVSLAQSDDPTDPTYEHLPTRLCDESVDVQTAQYHSTATGDYTAYWQARNYSAMLPDALDTSVFYIHGLQDWNVKPDHMVPWIDELHARDVPVKMWLGQWEHEYPTRDDFNQTLLRWLDHWLKGIDTGIMDEPLVQVQDTEGTWRDEDVWPLTRARDLVLHASEDGTLGPEPGEGGGAYADNPTQVGYPTPFGNVAPFLAFETTLDAPLRLVGAPVLHAHVSSMMTRGTISATLYVDGKVVDQGFLDLAHRNGMEESEPMTPAGDFVPVTVKFFPQDVTLPAGATLKLVLSHEAPDDAPVQVRPSAVNGAVAFDHGAGTTLTLPVIDADDVTLEARQPEDVGCWAC